MSCQLDDPAKQLYFTIFIFLVNYKNIVWNFYLYYCKKMKKVYNFKKTTGGKKMGVADFLTGIKGFKDLNANDIAALDSVCAEESFNAGDIIFQEEGPGDKMYIIKNGSVKIVKKVKDKENTIAVLNPGEFFGEMALLDGLPRSAGARANTAVTAISISRDNYFNLRQKFPQTALKIIDILIKVLSNRLRQANKNLEVIQFWIE